VSCRPAALRDITPLDPNGAVVTRDLLLKRSGLDACGRQSWKINGLGWFDISEFPELGTVEIWRFINDSGVAHPMHMHLVAFQILDRDGFTKGPGGEIIPNGNPQAPAAEEAGWKDTALVGPNQILRVITRFEDYKGKYAYHCHILEHEDNEMMRQFESVQCGDGELDATEQCDDGNQTSGDGCYATCDFEDSFRLYGVAQGGSVSVTVDGVLVTVATTAGQTPAQIVAALAAAIGANSTLSEQGTTAVAIGSRLVTNGTLAGPTLTDPGLSSEPPVPSFSGWGLGLAALSLLFAGLGPLARRID
jgi:cysteine-rich repeat protein